jgi:hypothetical protein
LFPDRDVELIKEVVFAGHYTDLVVSIFQGQRPIFLFSIQKLWGLQAKELVERKVPRICLFLLYNV